MNEFLKPIGIEIQKESMEIYRIDRRALLPKNIEFEIMEEAATSDLFEAVRLEKGVSAEILAYQGQPYELEETFKVCERKKGTIPEGQMQVKISSNNPNLDGFWNTFYALREYNQHVSQ